MGYAPGKACNLERMFRCFPLGQLRPEAGHGMVWRGLMGSGAILARFAECRASRPGCARLKARRPVNRHERKRRGADRGKVDLHGGLQQRFATVESQLRRQDWDTSRYRLFQADTGH